MKIEKETSISKEVATVAVDGMFKSAEEFVESWEENNFTLDEDNREQFKVLFMEGYKAGFAKCTSIYQDLVTREQAKKIISNL